MFNLGHKDAAIAVPGRRYSPAALANLQKLAARSTVSEVAPPPAASLPVPEEAAPSGDATSSGHGTAMHHVHDSDMMRVFVRVRPAKAHDSRVLSIESPEHTVVLSDGSRFQYNRVFDGEDNSLVFRHVGMPLVRSVLEGYNGTLIAYGQTGTGKTYTLGEAALVGGVEEGITPRMLRHLFNEAIEETPIAMRLAEEAPEAGESTAEGKQAPPPPPPPPPQAAAATAHAGEQVVETRASDGGDGSPLTIKPPPPPPPLVTPPPRVRRDSRGSSEPSSRIIEVSLSKQVSK